MSVIEKAIETARNRRAGDKIAATRVARKTQDPSAVSGLFKALTATRVDSDVMEQNKLLPAVADRAAITAYKMMRTRILHRMRSNNWRSLIVTSASPGDGKTTTACNLAVSMARDVNQGVILVDLDLQRASMAAYFGLDVPASIGDYLTGTAEIEDIFYAPEGLERIAIIPNREPVPNSSELLSSPRMRALLDWTQQSSQGAMTVFDMPPVLACDDVLAFSPFVDAILLVVAEGVTERAALTRTMDMLGDCNLLGVVLNRSREQAPTSAYY